MTREQLIALAIDSGAYLGKVNDWLKYNIIDENDVVFTKDEFEKCVQRIIELETPRIRSEALQDAAAYVLANATIKNSCCSETRASIYALIKGMDQK